LDKRRTRRFDGHARQNGAGRVLDDAGDGAGLTLRQRERRHQRQQQKDDAESHSSANSHVYSSSTGKNKTGHHIASQNEDMAVYHIPMPYDQRIGSVTNYLRSV